jgi:chemotaxis protein methyltransferase CheR
MILTMPSHERPLSEGLLERFSRFVEARAGLHFPRARWADLRRALHAAAPEIGCESAEECALLLLSEGASKEVLDLFLSHVTVGETYFFRDKAGFDALEQQALPELIGARRTSSKRLRIWSAGCCTGEEAYSIAIAVSRALPDLADWHVTILGTDINPRFLRKAEAGIYSEWSFRGKCEGVKEQYFRRLENGRLEIAPRIKKLVSFGCMNLVEDACPTLLHETNAMDIIFCRNVLMYFSFDQAKNVAGKLYKSLVGDGWLFPGGTEASRELFGRFTASNAFGAMVYRKSASPEPVESPRLTMRDGPRAAKENPRPSLKDPEKDAARSPSQPTKAPPKSPAALAEQAQRLANEGRLAEALAACDEAVRADKLASFLHYLRGLILDENGAREDAEVALKRALFLDQDFVLAHFALGNLMRRQGRWHSATRCFKNASDLLRECAPDAALPESGGITARRLLAILDATRDSITIL